MRKVIFCIVILFLLSNFFAFSKDSEEENLSEAEKKILNQLDKMLKERIDKIKTDLREIIIQELEKWEEEHSKPLNIKIEISRTLHNALSTITEEELKEHIDYLASDELEGRETGKAGCDKAAEYIANFFKEIGLKPIGDHDSYYQSFTIGKKKLKTQNVIGYIEGSDEKLKDEYIIIGAHYDHVGKGKDIGFGRLGAFRKKKAVEDPQDIIYNGADDNASGTCTVLEIAEAFTEAKLKPKRTVVFILFSGEEMELLGSFYYVKNPVFPLHKTSLMINLDMVGRNPTQKLYSIGSKSSPELHEIVRQVSSKLDLGVNILQGIGFGGSDHMAFIRKTSP